ncbi:unnamed protein product, partial [Prorocentrum cordatum]
GHGPLPVTPFNLELSATSVLGAAVGTLALPDTLAPAPCPAALAALPAAAASPIGGGLGALAAALGGGAPAPAAAAAAPAGAGGALVPPAAAAAVGDPRAMALVLDGRGLRDLSFGDALKLQTETVRADWPVKGPRTLLWVLGFMQRMADGFMAWHTSWSAMTKLGEHDESAKLRETMRRVIETALCHDQIARCELAPLEYLARQLQLGEGRVCEEPARRMQPAPKARAQAKEANPIDFASEVGHLLGTGETKGNLCVSPALMDWMGLASTPFLLESLVSYAQSPSGPRLVWSRPDAATIASAGWREWCNEGLTAIHWLHCGKDELSEPRDSAHTPAVQAASAEYLADQHREFELPAANSERGSACEASPVQTLAPAPGYAGDSGRVRPYSKPLAAWPESTKAVSTSDVVAEADSIVLQGWRQSMLNPESVAAASFTTGLFFAGKSNHMLGLAFDTRLANCSFAAPPATRLPAPSARASADRDDSIVFA